MRQGGKSWLETNPIYTELIRAHTVLEKVRPLSLPLSITFQFLFPSSYFKEGLSLESETRMLLHNGKLPEF
jgi:hypothetical protein